MSVSPSSPSFPFDALAGVALLALSCPWPVWLRCVRHRTFRAGPRQCCSGRALAREHVLRSQPGPIRTQGCRGARDRCRARSVQRLVRRAAHGFQREATPRHLRRHVHLAEARGHRCSLCGGSKCHDIAHLTCRASHARGGRKQPVVRHAQRRSVHFAECWRHGSALSDPRDLIGADRRPRPQEPRVRVAGFAHGDCRRCNFRQRRNALPHLGFSVIDSRVRPADRRTTDAGAHPAHPGMARTKRRGDRRHHLLERPTVPRHRRTASRSNAAHPGRST